MMVIATVVGFVVLLAAIIAIRDVTLLSGWQIMSGYRSLMD